MTTQVRIVERWPGINPVAYDHARTVDPDLRRLMVVAKPKLEYFIMSHTRSLPLFVRCKVRAAWWLTLKLLIPELSQLIIEFLMVRKGIIKAEDASECVRSIMSGAGVTDWEKA